MNKIICGDALSELKKIASETIDLIITSPPYFSQRKYQEISDPKEIGLELNISEYLENIVAIFGECVRICKDSGNIVFNIGDMYLDKNLQMVPFKFAHLALNNYLVKLVNTITWVKTNPTPRQYKKRLIPSTEPFFHFVKSDNYFYNLDSFLKKDTRPLSIKTNKKGEGYKKQIINSDLFPAEKINALKDLEKVVEELRLGKITDFRIKIRGVHKKAFGGKGGGRNSQIDKTGYTVIRMRGESLKRDVIECSVANSKNIDHIAIFPLTLIKELIYLLSKEGDVVLDPFCGSGTVCLAAKELNRNYIGIDLYKNYCELAEKRLNKE
jgi:DNA modification methylase